MATPDPSAGLLTVPSALGTVGVVCILTTYWLLQTERIKAGSPWYSAANAVGAGLILYSLYFDFNLPAALVEGAWLLISLYGLGRSLRARKRSQREEEPEAVKR